MFDGSCNLYRGEGRGRGEGGGGSTWDSVCGCAFHLLILLMMMMDTGRGGALRALCDGATCDQMKVDW